MTQRAQLNVKDREKQISIAKSQNETLVKARDNSMKQSERLILQVSSFEKELTERRAKEATLKSEILTLEQEKRNTLQKENETHEKFIHANAKFEKEKKLKNELEHTIERLQAEIRYSADAREDLAAKNQIFKRKISENDGEMAKIRERLGKNQQIDFYENFQMFHKKLLFACAFQTLLKIFIISQKDIFNFLRRLNFPKIFKR